MRASGRLVALAALALAIGAPPAPAQNGGGAATAAREPVLQPGDQVRITVWRKAELSGELTVGPDGTLVHPLYRTVRVTGVPFSAVEARLGAFLEQYEARPQFVAEPLVRIAVGGEVPRANLYWLRPETTVGQALATAGGPGERGRRDRFLLFRDTTRIVVKVQGGDRQAFQSPIRSGDQLLVERRGSAFREVVAPIIGLTGSLAAVLTVVLRAK
jgi:polysaccharide export outer membrane protein